MITRIHIRFNKSPTEFESQSSGCSSEEADLSNRKIRDEHKHQTRHIPSPALRRPVESWELLGQHLCWPIVTDAEPDGETKSEIRTRTSEPREQMTFGEGVDVDGREQIAECGE